LREELAGLGNAELFRTCARFADMNSHEEAGEESVLQATRITLSLLAHRIGQLSAQIRNVDARLTRLVECHAPQLLDVVGIGPDTAVALLITVGDNPERLDSEAPFAALCGVSPIEYSSGRRSSRRLNHGGDRQVNAACTASCSPGCATTRAPRRTTNAAPRRARPDVRSSDASCDMPPERFSTWSERYPASPRDWGPPRGAVRCRSRTEALGAASA
jgi:hypothetical protein